MHESMLGWAIQAQPAVRNRILAIVQDKVWDGVTDPTRPVPLDALAWAVVANDAVRTQVRTALPEVDNNVARACDAITDAVLAPTVYSALTRLGYAV